MDCIKGPADKISQSPPRLRIDYILSQRYLKTSGKMQDFKVAESVTSEEPIYLIYLVRYFYRVVSRARKPLKIGLVQFFLKLIKFRINIHARMTVALVICLFSFSGTSFCRADL